MATILAISLTMICESYFVKADTYNLSNPLVSNNKTTWDCIYFGKYYQSNSNIKEPIKWRVLQVGGNQAFLLSDKILYRYEVKNEYLDKVTWETSSLRNWLNTDFYNNAFSSDEKNIIINSYIENKGFDWNVYSYEKDDFFKSDGGSNTYDKVFNLSIEEVNNKSFGFVSNDPDDNIFYSDTRYAEGTNYSGKREDNSWWLRTPGANNLPCVISEVAPKWAYYTTGDYYGVRPAIKINLNNEYWTKTGSVTLSHNYIEHKMNDLDIYNGESKTNQPDKSNSTNIKNKTEKKSNRGNVVVSTTSIKKIKAKKKTLTVKWKRVKGVTGYEIQYSLKQIFKNAKTRMIKKSSTTLLTIKKLKRRKKYYVRIRTYKRVDGKIYYSNWSKIKHKKTS